MKEKCYNNRCIENKDGFCSEDFMVVFGRTWIVCKNYIKEQNNGVEKEIVKMKNIALTALDGLEV